MRNTIFYPIENYVSQYTFLKDINKLHFSSEKNTKGQQNELHYTK